MKYTSQICLANGTEKDSSQTKIRNLVSKPLGIWLLEAEIDFLSWFLT